MLKLLTESKNGKKILKCWETITAKTGQEIPKRPVDEHGPYFYAPIGAG